eukprot:scaffold200757_cov17-Tisochrysis_lutea.AAC.2
MKGFVSSTGHSEGQRIGKNKPLEDDTSALLKRRGSTDQRSPWPAHMKRHISGRKATREKGLYGINAARGLLTREGAHLWEEGNTCCAFMMTYQIGFGKLMYDGGVPGKKTRACSRAAAARYPTTVQNDVPDRLWRAHA